jgi:putative transcriptional regulator
MDNHLSTPISNKFLKGGEKMILNRKKLEVAMAGACVNAYDLCKKAGVTYYTYQRISTGKNAKPATIGKLAKALGVSVEALIEN